MRPSWLWSGALPAVLLTAAWSSPGAIDNYDVQVRLRVAEQLVDEGRLVVGFRGDDDDFATFTDRHGPYPAYYGIGQSLLFLPFAAGARGVERLLPERYGPRAGRAFVALATFTLMLWLNVGLCVAVARAMGAAPFQAALAGPLAVFGSSFWQMAKQGQEEVQLSVLALAGLLAFYRWREAGWPGAVWLSAGALAAAGMIRPTAVTFAVGLGGLYCWEATRAGAGGTSVGSRLGRVLVPFLVMGCLTLLVVGAYNVFKTGSPLGTGYSPSQLTFRPGTAWSGIVGPTVGFDRGLVWQNLWLLPLALLCWRKRGALTTEAKLGLVLAGWLLGASLAIYCTWYTWAGDHTFGTKFQQHVVPLLGTALAVGALHGVDLRRRSRAVLATAVLTLAALQLPSLAFVHNLEILQALAEGVPPPGPGVTLTGPRGGQFRLRLANLQARLSTGATAPLDTAGRGPALDNFGLPGGMDPARRRQLASTLLADSSRWDFWPWRLEGAVPPGLERWAKGMWVLLVLGSLGAWLRLLARAHAAG